MPHSTAACSSSPTLSALQNVAHVGLLWYDAARVLSNSEVFISEPRVIQKPRVTLPRGTGVRAAPRTRPAAAHHATGPCSRQRPRESSACGTEAVCGLLFRFSAARLRYDSVAKLKAWHLSSYSSSTKRSHLPWYRAWLVRTGTTLNGHCACNQHR